MRRLPVFLAIAATAVTAVTAVALGYGSPLGSATEPPDEPSAAAKSSPPASDCGPATKWQRQLETALAGSTEYGEVTVDGQQSAPECATIAAFQERTGIEPADGRADALTAAVAARLADPALDDCEAAKHGRTVCVDLTNQLLWVVEDGELLVEPIVVRTGKPGYASTTGTFTINHRTKKEWSEPYEVWLPYFQHYYAGEGLHEATSYLHDPDGGSHGCVNLLPSDAKRLYGLLDYGDTIEVFGKRPGT